MIDSHMGEIGFCSFRLDSERYAIDILTVQEVNKQCHVTPAMGAPSWVRGLLNLRGQVVTVIDTGVALGLGPREITDASRLVILKTNAELALRGCDHLATSEDLVGLHVDEVMDVISSSVDQIDAPPAGSREKDMPSVRGVVQLEDGVLRVLDPQILLQFEAAKGN